MRDTLLMAALSIGLLGVVQTADAQGVRLGGDVTQTFQLNNNFNLGSSGLDFDSLTSGRVNISSKTPTTQLTASTGLTLSFGSGQSVKVSRPRLNLSFGHNTKDINFTGGLSYAKAPAAVDVVQPDLSVLRYTGDRTSISGRLGASTRLSPSTRVRFGLTANSLDYDPASAGLFPSVDYGVNADWSYQLSASTSFGISGGLGWFEAENASNTTSISANLSGTMTHQLTSTTTVDGNLGWSFIDTTDTISGVETNAFSVSLLFGAGLTQTLPDGSISVTLNQSVLPSSSGSLVLGTTIGGSYSKQVNANETYGVDASLSRQKAISGGTATSFLNVSPNYSRQLTRDVSATAAYSLQRDNNGGTAHGLSVSFTRPFDFPLR